MSGRPRLKNGRLCKQKVINQRLKAAKGRAEARKKKLENKNQIIGNESEIIIEGNRLVNLEELKKNLKCQQCQNKLSLDFIKAERREGLDTYLHITCPECKLINIVATAKKVQSEFGYLSEMNASAVLGTIYSGTGLTGLNKILSCLDVPVLSQNVYQRYQDYVGRVLETAAKESCRRAASEERQLVIDNVEKLCQHL